MSDSIQIVHESYVPDNFKTLVKGTVGSAGYDIASAVDLIIEPGQRALVDTGIRVRVPPGTYGQIAPKSSVAMSGVDVGAGVIDSDYTGVVKVLLINHAEYPFYVKKKKAVAQLLLVKVNNTAHVEVVGSLEETVRGCGGFGSTGNVCA